MILLGVHILPSLDFYNDSTLENKTLPINTQIAALAKIYFCILFVNVCVLRISSYLIFFFFWLLQVLVAGTEDLCWIIGIFQGGAQTL